MILVKVIAYILLSIGAIAFIAAGGPALLRGNKGHILLVKMNLIIAAFFQLEVYFIYVHYGRGKALFYKHF